MSLGTSLDIFLDLWNVANVFDQFLQMGRTVDDAIAETLSHRREERVISQICPGNLWGIQR